MDSGEARDGSSSMDKKGTRWVPSATRIGRVLSRSLRGPGGQAPGHCGASDSSSFFPMSSLLMSNRPCVQHLTPFQYFFDLLSSRPRKLARSSRVDFIIVLPCLVPSLFFRLSFDYLFTCVTLCIMASDTNSVSVAGKPFISCLEFRIAHIC